MNPDLHIEQCWICGKEKGQPPERCPGHYDLTLESSIGGLTISEVVRMRLENSALREQLADTESKETALKVAVHNIEEVNKQLEDQVAACVAVLKTLKVKLRYAIGTNMVTASCEWIEGANESIASAAIVLADLSAAAAAYREEIEKPLRAERDEALALLAHLGAAIKHFIWLCETDPAEWPDGEDDAKAFSKLKMALTAPASTWLAGQLAEANNKGIHEENERWTRLLEDCPASVDVHGEFAKSLTDGDPRAELIQRVLAAVKAEAIRALVTMSCDDLYYWRNYIPMGHFPKMDEGLERIAQRYETGHTGGIPIKERLAAAKRKGAGETLDALAIYWTEEGFNGGLFFQEIARIFRDGADTFSAAVEIREARYAEAEAARKEERLDD